MADRQHTRNLVIGNVTILRDQYGRYNLNTLHRAGGYADKHRPSQWARTEKAQELINQLNAGSAFLHFEVVTGGKHAGTWGDEIIAVAYAAWISTEFEIVVYQAFLDLRDLKQEGLLDGKALTPNEMFLQQAHINIEQEKRLDRVDAKVNLALASQQWLTIRQYMYLNDLKRQMPIAACKAFGTFLTGYCLERDIPVEARGVAIKAWGKENAYHAELIAELLPPWLKRRNGQIDFGS